MRALDLLWLLLTLPGLLATWLLFRERLRIYRLARRHSLDERDWELACHDLRREGMRVGKQILLTAGVCVGLWGRVAWVFETRSVIFVAVAMTLLAVSVYDLSYTRRARQFPLP